MDSRCKISLLNGFECYILGVNKLKLDILVGLVWSSPNIMHQLKKNYYIVLKLRFNTINREWCILGEMEPCHGYWYTFFTDYKWVNI